jgi:PPOX class probable F420-dependent enzyme
MVVNRLHFLKKHNYISLTTFRKSGVAVPTPVWFTLKDDKFYVVTSLSTGKVKRIRNNPRVQVAPSDFKGKIKGETFFAQARFMPAEEYDKIERLFKKKYGIQYWLFGMAGRANDSGKIYIEFTPEVEEAV